MTAFSRRSASSRVPSKDVAGPFLAVFRQAGPRVPQRTISSCRFLLARRSSTAFSPLVTMAWDCARQSSLVRLLRPPAFAPRNLGSDEIAREVLAGLHKPSRSSSASESLRRPTVSDKENRRSDEADRSGDHKLLKASHAAFHLLLDADPRGGRANSRMPRTTFDVPTRRQTSCGGLKVAAAETSTSRGALKDGAAVIAGTELADLTDVALGPRTRRRCWSACSRTPRAREGREGWPLHAYVNAVPDDWARERAAKFDERVLDLTPLSLALPSGEERRIELAAILRLLQWTEVVHPWRQLASLDRHTSRRSSSARSPMRKRRSDMADAVATDANVKAPGSAEEAEPEFIDLFPGLRSERPRRRGRHAAIAHAPGGLRRSRGKRQDDGARVDLRAPEPGSIRGLQVRRIEVAPRLRGDLPPEPACIGCRSTGHASNGADRGDEVLPPRAARR